MKMSDLLKKHGLTFGSEYWRIIIESFKNGQHSQAIEQFRAMSVANRKAMVISLVITYRRGITDRQLEALINNI